MRSELPYCLFPRWPEDGDSWIHPDDLRLARRLLPGTRVFRRCGRAGAYTVLRYGNFTLRVRPALQMVLRGDGLDIADQVEICSHLGQNRPLVARIGEMNWNARYGVIEYRVRRREMTLARRYTASDLRLIAKA